MGKFYTDVWMSIDASARKKTGTNYYSSPDDIGQMLKRNLENHENYRDYIKTKGKRRHH